MQKLVTIGGYGFSEETFADALRVAGVGAFVDIRQRRGLRGSKYAFLNSRRLQAMMQRIGIRYIYLKELAPTADIRDVQKDADKETGVSKSARAKLSETFVNAYQQNILALFDSASVEAIAGKAIDVVALFCVESRPEACHRSVAASKIASDLGVALEHLLP